MTTWDDKPNDYEHAVEMLKQRDAEIDRLRAALNDLAERAAEEGAHHLAIRAKLAVTHVTQQQPPTNLDIPLKGHCGSK